MLDINEKIKEEFGFVPLALLKDPYAENIKWLLKRFEKEFDSSGELHFKLNVIMEKFNSKDIEANSFKITQNSKLDKINRLGEYPGYILSCGFGGEDIDGQRLFYYKREPVSQKETFMSKFGDLEQSEKKEKSSIKIGTETVDIEDIKGAEFQ